MKLQGQFIRGDGLVIPNNVSLAGAKMLLAAALRGDVPTLYAGLIVGFPSQNSKRSDVVEPTIGVHGYSRIQIPQDHVGWPIEGQSGVQRFVKSMNLVWTATGGNFDQSIQRLALFIGPTSSPTEDIFCMSAPLPTAEVITPATDPALRTFQYQLFL